MTAQHPFLPDEPSRARPQRTLVVTLASKDDAALVDFPEFGRLLAENIARHEGEGWHLVSTSVTTLRQSGTAGNMWLQTGGQFATMLGAVIVYQRSR